MTPENTPNQERIVDGSKTIDPKPAYVDELVLGGWLKTPRIIEAFTKIDRAWFLPVELRALSGMNAPILIGHGQTVSQPLTVAIMLEALQPRPGDRCLDVGAGSGWVSALLAELVGRRGRVIAVERIPSLAAKATDRIHARDNPQVTVVNGDASRGWFELAPYDVMHVAAAAPAIPLGMKNDLATGGRLVIPIGHDVQDLVLLTKIGENRFTERRWPGFQFVPLIATEHQS